MMQDETLGQVSSMRGFLGQVFLQTLECAFFTGDQTETKTICES
jgi:hypothetical protein